LDFATLTVAIIGALSGGAAAAAGGAYRNRVAVKSAARLIHAELTDNSAPVRYYRSVGSWPPRSEIRHAAWDTYGVTLSRMRQPEGFHAIQKGYSALEGIAFISRIDASSEQLPSVVANQIVEMSIAEVADALKKAGDLAGIAPRDLRTQLDPMVSQASRSGDALAQLGAIGGVVPAWTLDAIVNAGSASQSASASKTLEGMEAQLSSAEARIRRLSRTVYDAQRKPDVHDVGDAKVARSEGQPPTGDPAVDEAYDGLGAFFTFFAEVFNRDSVDGKGQPLDAIVHYDASFNNAVWNGQVLLFGDGDGEIFNRFTIALDVIATELSKGVIDAQIRLLYEGQPGALSQSLADVFGVLVKQHSLRQTVVEADWLVGAGLFTDTIHGVDGKPAALRSMARPGTAYDDDLLGKDPQPDHMDNYVETEQDNRGVHINCGIPNHAFYTTAMTLGGFAWERAGRIWYEALRDPLLTKTAQFQTFASATRSAASRLYGDTSEEVAAVETGWSKIGLSAMAPEKTESRPRRRSRSKRSSRSTAAARGKPKPQD
jgi:thermolysin metallopeptidase-like protein